MIDHEQTAEERSTSEQPDPREASGRGRFRPARPRWMLPTSVIGLSVAFIGMATLFAGLLQPIAEAPALAVATKDPTFHRLDTIRPADGNVAPQPAATGAAPGSTVKVGSAAPALIAPALPTDDGFRGPRIAIVLTELGGSEPTLDDAMTALPNAVSFAFSPYFDTSRALAAKARSAGYEIWLGVPMQPRRYPRVSPGANALLTGNAPAENIRRLEWALSRVEGAVGVYPMMGSAFTENAAALRPVLGTLRARRLAFLDARSSGKSIGEAEALAAGLAAAMNDRFLDENPSPSAIDANLAALEQIARREGSAIGFARALPVSIAQIDAWADTLEAKGIRLVPAGTIAARAQRTALAATN